MVSDPNGVTVGIDAAVVANHQVAIRGSVGGEVIDEDFSVAPTLAGLERLTGRMSEYPGALVVAEPTAMSWLSLGHAATDAGCGFTLIETRHSSKLREAIAGKNKSDVIDADMLAVSADLFGLSASELPTPGRVALRRAVRRRHRMTAQAHNADVRLWAIASWAFPDVWKAMAGSHRLARTVLGRWPRLDQLGRAHIASLCIVVPGMPTQRRRPRTAGGTDQRHGPRVGPVLDRPRRPSMGVSDAPLSSCVASSRCRRRVSFCHIRLRISWSGCRESSSRPQLRPLTVCSVTRTVDPAIRWRTGDCARGPRSPKVTAGHGDSHEREGRPTWPLQS